MRGLLAIECLYHQIVAGNKIQTRRSGGLEAVNDKYIDNWRQVSAELENGKLSVVFKNGLIGKEVCKSRYRVGEVLYLKEPTMLFSCPVSEKERLVYKYELMGDLDLRINGKWSNKLFMAEADARAFIKITGIRCERLLDISYEDCYKEGIHICALPGQAKCTLTDYLCKGLQTEDLSPRESFLSLYKFANKVKEVPNLWVWVYEIEYLKGYKHGD